MAYQIGNKGYMAFKKETSKGSIAGIPSIYVPFYEENLMTMPNLDEDTPVVGNLFARYQTFLGMRSHGGDAKILAEPVTAGYLLDMILKKGTSVGLALPYTHPFTISETDPNSYTVDIQKGQVVARFLGVEASELGIEFDKNKMLFNTKFHALKSFIVREVSSVSGSGPYTLTLKTNYDESPTDGLYVADTMRALLANGTTIDFAVATIPAGGLTLTTSTNISTLASGDLIFIKASVPSYSTLAPFNWAQTKFLFGATAATVFVEGARASGILTSNETAPVDGDMVTIGSIVYRFKTTMAQAYDVQRDADADISLANLVKAINATGTAGVEYFAGTVVHPNFRSGAVIAHAITVTANLIGVAGNAFAKAETSDNLDWDGATAFFTGGTDVTASAQTRVEDGSKWNLLHKLEKDEGAQRSGSYDPAALVRTLGDVELTLKQYFDTPEDMNRFLTNQKRALVIRHFSTGSLYELRLTINNYRIMENPTPVKTKEVIYSESKVIPNFDVADGQAFDIKLINNVLSI